jgi:hopanoid biosynthesis associated RND transporter like protein HpnN
MFDRIVAWLVRQSLQSPRLVIALGLSISLAAGLYTVQRISIDTDATKLLSAELPWRKREAVFDAAFPQNIDLLAIVIDSPTPELAERATALLTERLKARTDLFRSVRRPDGGPFFDRNGLLYLSVDEVQATTEQIVAAQPLLGPLTVDPTLRGLFGALSTFVEGIIHGAAQFDVLEKPMDEIAKALDAAANGKIAAPSWRQMFTNQTPRPQELRRFILTQPKLDFTSVTPGADAAAAIRSMAKELDLDPEHGIRVRLTGPVALSDEEFGTLAEGMSLSGFLSVAAVGILLFIGLGSFKLIGAILITLTAGLIITAGFATLSVGSLNLISIAFAVLFWGIAVDFGIQVSVAYRQARFELGDPDQSLVRALHNIGTALGLAAITTAVGFFSLLPTDYRGVSELGLIAGAGMIIALILNVTMLPALLKLFRPRGEKEAVGYLRLAPLDTFLLDHRRLVLTLAMIMAVISALACIRLEFDFNPLNIKDQKTESVSTLLDLMKEPTTTPNTIDVLTASAEIARDLATRLGQLGEVAHAVSIHSYIPEQQEDKLAYIEDARQLLAPTFAIRAQMPPPDDADLISAFKELRTKLDQLPTQNPTAERMKRALTRMIDGPPAHRALAAEALVPGLGATINQLKTALEAQLVTFDTLPADLRAAWISKDGKSRVELFPAGDANDNDVLRQFVAAVRAIAPDATGTPVSIQESSRTVVGAFVQSGILALVAISLLLMMILRSVRDVAVVIAPLMLAGLLTLGTCVVIGLPLNFANIIALPLLFGIGVAFNIYFVMAWRQGKDHLLQSSLTRAIVFSAASTASAFGSLALSSHPGTAEMGILLSMSLTYTLVTTMLVLPSLLGRAHPTVAQ